MAKKPPKKSLSSRAAHDPALLARVLANPGLRSKLSDAQLTPAMRAKRQENTKLNAPVTTGSTMTYRDQARTANAQTQVRYGDAEQALGTELGHAQGVARDTPDWYAAYQADLATHAQNVNTIGGAATTALSNQAQGIRGLDQAALNAQQGAANADAAGRGATAGNLGPDASNASTVRQAMLAALAGSQTGANAANSTYADTLAHVVAPGQKLQAVTQAQGKVGEVQTRQTALQKEKGAFNQSARDSIRADEVKNVLTQQALGVTTAKASADISATTTKTAKTAADTAYFNKHGYYPGTGPPKKPAAPSGYKAGAPGLNKYGYTYDEWTGLTPKAQAAARAGKGKTPKPVDPATKYSKDFYAAYGVKPAPTAAVNKAKDAVQTASTWVREIRQSNPDKSLAEIGQLLTRGQAKGKGADEPAVPKQSALWVRVAMDLAQYKGKISAGTASRLHKAGYSVKVLGLATVPGKGSSTYVSPPKPASTGSRGDG